MMSRLQQHQHPLTERLALCHRATLDSVAHRWVPARTPTVHRCQTGKVVGGPTLPPRRRPTTNDNKTQTSLKTNVLSATSVVTHLGTYMVAEQRGDDMASASKWRSPGSSRRSRRETKPITQEKINQETEYIKIHQNQCTDKAVDVSVVMQEQVSQIQLTHRELEKGT